MFPLKLSMRLTCHFFPYLGWIFINYHKSSVRGVSSKTKLSEMDYHNAQFKIETNSCKIGNDYIKILEKNNVDDTYVRICSLTLFLKYALLLKKWALCLNQLGDVLCHS